MHHNHCHHSEFATKLFHILQAPPLSVCLSILTAIFPGEPGLAGFTGAKDDGYDLYFSL